MATFRTHGVGVMPQPVRLLEGLETRLNLGPQRLLRYIFDVIA